jgi:hypothetical protein
MKWLDKSTCILGLENGSIIVKTHKDHVKQIIPSHEDYCNILLEIINSNDAIRVQEMIIRLDQKETRIGLYHNNYKACIYKQNSIFHDFRMGQNNLL